MLITDTLPAELGITITGITSTTTGIVSITLASSRTTVACPLCFSAATHQHSRYVCTLTDLPWQGAGRVLAPGSPRPLL
jgi:hypothetical protein